MNRPDEGIESGTVLLGKYRVDERIGRGGMGLVYRAHHLALDEQVAIKILRADVQLDEEAVQRFQREARAAVRLKSEHVARISDVGTFEDGSPFIVMEFLAGADLGTIVDTNGPMEVGQAIDFVLQACDALAEAHSLDIIHRDVKPSNLFVTTRPDGAPILKILDFGISKSAHGTDLSLTQTASVLGTPAYMSPEQMRSARRVDGRTDIWSLGTVLYELVEGRRPFQAETFSEMCVMAAADPHEPMLIAPQLESVIARCLAKTPEGRHPSIAELARDLAPFASDPQRAQFYVSRIHRVLGRPLDSRPFTQNMMRTPVPGMLATGFGSGAHAQPNMNAASSGGLPGLAERATPAVTLSTVVDPPRRSRTNVVVALMLLVTAVAIAIVVVTNSSGAKQAASDGRPKDGEGGGGGEGDGSARNEVVTMPMSSPEGTRSGSAAGVGDASGSATGSGDANAVGTGSAVASTATGGGSAKPIKNQGHQQPIVKRGGGKTDVRKGASDAKGSGDTKKGSGTGSANPAITKKQCDPFASARAKPCPKE